MSPVEAITLFGVMLSLAALPSSSVALVVARSATLGVVNGVAVALGVVVGDLIFIMLALTGLAVAADALGGVFVVVSVVAGLYLIGMGISLLRSKPSNLDAGSYQTSSKHLVTSFLAGLFLTLGDVKAIIFYASLFPVFVNITEADTAHIATIVVITIVSVGSVKLGYAVFGGQLAHLVNDQRLSRMAARITGCFFIGAGCFLLYKA